MERIFAELREQKNVRSNLSSLRAELKTDTDKNADRIHSFVSENEALVFGFLQNEDAKTRKNAALLLGDLFYEPAMRALFTAYQKEKTLFVRSAYLTALLNMDVTEFLPQIKERRTELESQSVSEEEQKHIGEELRALQAILIRREGITKHTFRAKRKVYELLLVTNRNHRGFVARQAGGKVHPLGVTVQTENLFSLLQVRTFREMLFLLPIKGLLSANPREAADAVWEPMLELCRACHEEEAPFYFRVECKSAMTLEERSRFTRKLCTLLEQYSKGMLINSPGDYEVELRLFVSREGEFLPALKFSTLPDNRFTYRKNAISASIHPSTAALMMELAAPYLKENAQIMDPFCGVGTMLIERDIRVPAREKYGTDIFGDAIEGGRENASRAGEQIHFIHRDFFDFKHEYLFDEIVTNMPVRGKMSREEMDLLYERFFEKALTILKREAVIVMYTGELGFVKKQLRLHKEFSLLEEYCMQTKTGYYLLIIGVNSR